MRKWGIRSKDEDVLLGCAVLKAMAPGLVKSHECIAEACGVSKALIVSIERIALNKLRHPAKELSYYR